jgi:hypothetical protein
MAVTEVEPPLMHLLSVTLQAARAMRRRIRASRMMWSPAWTEASSTEIVRSGWMVVCMNEVTGVMVLRSRPSAVLMFCRQEGWSFLVEVVVHLRATTRVNKVVLSDSVFDEVEHRLVAVGVQGVADVEGE